MRAFPLLAPFLGLTLGLVLLPAVAFAIPITPSTCPHGEVCSKDNLTVTPPLDNLNLDKLGLDKIASYLAGLVGTVAVLFVVWGGIIYITAGGDTEKIEKARRIIVYSLVGLVLAALSYVAVTTVLHLAYQKG